MSPKTPAETRPKGLTLKDLIAEATARYVEDLEQLAGKWAEANGRTCGPLSPRSVQHLAGQAGREIDGIIRISNPPKRAPAEGAPVLDT